MDVPMKKYSSDKNINVLVNRLVNHYGWSCKKGRHPKLITPSGKRLSVPSTPSDKRRAFQNFKHDVRRLQGF